MINVDFTNWSMLNHLQVFAYRILEFVCCCMGILHSPNLRKLVTQFSQMSRPIRVLRWCEWPAETQPCTVRWNYLSTVEVWEWISNFIPHFIMDVITYRILIHARILTLVNPLGSTTCTVILTHWGRVTHICVDNLTIIGSENGLSPGRRQAIIWTNDRILLIGPLGTNFNEILIEIHTFSLKKKAFKKFVWKMAAILSRPQCVMRWSSSHFGESFQFSTALDKTLWFAVLEKHIYQVLEIIWKSFWEIGHRPSTDTHGSEYFFYIGSGLWNCEHTWSFIYS